MKWFGLLLKCGKEKDLEEEKGKVMVPLPTISLKIPSGQT